MARNEVFISYSRDDIRHVEDFLEILKPYLVAGPQIWSDQRLDPGDLWLPAIKRALASAKVAVLLVTPAFLASEFISRVEFPEILRAQEEDGLVVFWIPVSSSGYKQTVLRDFTAASEPGRPLDLMTVPKRRNVWVRIAERLMQSAAVIERTGLPPKPRLVILHRTGTQPDESISKLLESGLTERGYEVFTVKETSLEVLNQLDNHLTRADCVVPLISAASDSSEMLGMHVQMAQAKSEKQSGRPQLVPLFIQYDACGGGVGRVCQALRRVTWRCPQDDATLVQRLITVLNGGQDEAAPPAGRVEAREDEARSPGGDSVRESMPQVPLQTIGGAVPEDDPYYVVRATDEGLREALSRHTSVIRIQGARQMGKTSLLLRGLRLARAAGARIVSVDFQAFNRSQFESQQTFYRSLAEAIVDDLQVDDLDVAAFWSPGKSANWNLDRFVRRHLLPRIEGRLIWAMDEVERLYQFDLSDDFFGLIRSWHNSRSKPSEALLDRLTIIISHATESHLFVPGIIRNPNASPFNIATSLFLADFTPDEVNTLNSRFDRPLRTRAELDTLYDLVGGQPFLVRRSLEIVRAGESLNHLVESASSDSGPFADHLRRIVQVLATNEPLLYAVQAYLAHGEPLSTEEFYRLRTAGIFAGETAAAARPRCRIYADSLKRNLLMDPVRRRA